MVALSGNSFHRPTEGEFHGPVVEPVDAVEVGSTGIEIHARQHHQRLEVMCAKRSLFDEIGHGLCHSGLDRAEHLPDLSFFLQRHLGDDQRCRLGKEVWPHDREKRRVPGRELGEGIGKRCADRTLFLTDNEVDMSQFGPVADQCFTYKIHTILRIPAY